MNFPETKDAPGSLYPGKLLCFGMGFSSQALARRLVPQGWQVSGTVRGVQDEAKLRNISVINYDCSNSTLEISEAISALHIF